MEALLVLYKTPAAEGTHRSLYVVPARLPAYGDEHVLEKGKMGLGDSVVRTSCSFRRSYAPPGIIGRFLAFANAHIMEARECWQHGAHLIWTPGSHDVLVYEAHSVEAYDDRSVTYPGLVLCVKGNSPEVREVLASVTSEVKRLLQDKVHGYPGLCSVVFEGTDEVYVGDIIGDLRKYLDNRFDRLDATVRKVAAVATGVLQEIYLADETKNQYPRLVLMKPETHHRPEVEVHHLPSPGSSPTVGDPGKKKESGPAAAEGMQRETWNRWICALNDRKKVRLVFLCEHDLTEVECGPDGKGYVIEDLPSWTKGCLPLLQVTVLRPAPIRDTVSTLLRACRSSTPTNVSQTNNRRKISLMIFVKVLYLEIYYSHDFRSLGRTREPTFRLAAKQIHRYIPIQRGYICSRHIPRLAKKHRRQHRDFSLI